MTLALLLLALMTVVAALAFSFWRAAVKAEEERRKRLEYDLEILRAVKVSGRPRLTVIAGGRSAP